MFGVAFVFLVTIPVLSHLEMSQVTLVDLCGKTVYFSSDGKLCFLMIYQGQKIKASAITCLSFMLYRKS